MHQKQKRYYLIFVAWYLYNLIFLKKFLRVVGSVVFYAPQKPKALRHSHIWVDTPICHIRTRLHPGTDVTKKFGFSKNPYGLIWSSRRFRRSMTMLKTLAAL